MKILTLSQGYVAWVDDEDYPVICGLRWHAQVDVHEERVYAASRFGSPCGGLCLMHRLILDAPSGTPVDHITHELLKSRIVDNRRSNLRLASAAQNNANGRKGTGKSSIFKGVCWAANIRKWEAHIQVSGAKRGLGYSTAEGHAAYAYGLAAVRFFGSRALTNFPIPGASQFLFGTDHGVGRV